MPAYIATAAIGLAFVCSLIGLVMLLSHHDQHEAEESKLEHKVTTLKGEQPHLEEAESDLNKEVWDLQNKVDKKEATPEELADLAQKQKARCWSAPGRAGRAVDGIGGTAPQFQPSIEM